MKHFREYARMHNFKKYMVIFVLFAIPAFLLWFQFFPLFHSETEAVFHACVNKTIIDFTVDHKDFRETAVKVIGKKSGNTTSDNTYTVQKIINYVNNEHFMYKSWQHKSKESMQYYPYYNTIRFGDDPRWILRTRYGGCGEHAELTAALANSIGLPSRVLHAPGEDHAWNEILLNDNWTHVDSTLPEEYSIGHPEYYEQKWGYNLSRVYYIDSTGQEQEITQKYTNTSTLVVKTYDQNRAISHVKIIIKSRYLIENKPDYKFPYTDFNGIATFELGGNNYEIIAQKDIIPGILGYQVKKNVTLAENISKTIVLKPRLGLLSSPLKIWITLLSYLLLCLLSIMLGFLIYPLLKKRKKDKST